jgi:hypothetical protein
VRWWRIAKLWVAYKLVCHPHLEQEIMHYRYGSIR